MLSVFVLDSGECFGSSPSSFVPLILPSLRVFSFLLLYLLSVVFSLLSWEFVRFRLSMSLFLFVMCRCSSVVLYHSGRDYTPLLLSSGDVFS